jgi:hypothetical protein
MTADALTPKIEVVELEKTSAPADDVADGVASDEADWSEFTTPRAFAESLPSYEGTIIVATVWLVTYLLMAFCYYTGTFG